MDRLLWLSTALVATGCGVSHPVPAAVDTSPTLEMVTSTCGGALSISGTVDVPATTPVDRPVRLTVATAGTGPGSCVETKEGVTTTGSHKIHYKISQLTANIGYLVSVEVDLTGTTAYGEAGDLIGYFAGTLTAPLLTSATANQFVLTKDYVNADFGIGVHP